MADEAERKRKRTEEQASLQSINRSALIFPNNASMAPELECPICHDVMLIPIQCRRGHSACSHCARQLASTTGGAGAAAASGDAMCPTCRGPMNLKDPTINFALQKMIDRVACRCPNAAAAFGHGVAGGEGACPWRGTFEVLEAHLRVCDYAPKPCPFAPHGCKAVLAPAAMRVHHVDRASYHSGLVADRFEALDKRFTDMEVTLKTRIAEVETTFARNAAAAPTVATTLASAVPPRKWTVRWNIPSVSLKIHQRATILSKRFTVQAPGLGTYAMQLEGTFTSSGGFEFFIAAMIDGSASASSSSLNLQGTTVDLVPSPRAAGYGCGVVANASAAVQPGRRWGWDQFCSDLSAFIQDDGSIVINVKLRVQNEVVWV